MTKFSLEKILRIKQQRETKECGVLKYHYERILGKIKDRYLSYHDHVVYDVDNFILKLPIYNADEVAGKLVDFMIKKGFKCEVLYQNRVYCWWNPKRKKKMHIPVILKIIYDKIETAATNNCDSILYEIPIFLKEFPLYDTSEAADIIVCKLRKKGFISTVSSSVVYISWKKEDIEIKTKKKIKFETDEVLKKKALDKISYINGGRLRDFANPKNTTMPSATPAATPSTSIDTEKFMKGLNNLKSDVNYILNK